MPTLSDIVNLETHDQFFSYADAYLSASAVLCRQMENEDTRYTWPHASVVLMLSAHAVELFLKGALLKSMNKLEATHDIQQLAEKYREMFTDPALAWDIPFANELSKTELVAQMKQLWSDIDETKLRNSIDATPDPSILYRYPVNKAGMEWQGAYGFTPTGFLPRLEQLELDFKRIRLELDKLRS